MTKEEWNYLNKHLPIKEITTQEEKNRARKIYNQYIGNSVCWSCPSSVRQGLYALNKWWSENKDKLYPKEEDNNDDNKTQENA